MTLTAKNSAQYQHHSPRARPLRCISNHDYDDTTKQMLSTIAEKTSSSSTLSDSTRVVPSRREKCWNTWTPEIAALIFSITCTAAIAVVLAVYNGKPIPKIPTGITLNALIAILATASKSALLFSLSNSLGQLKWVWVRHDSARSLQDMEIFDDASRGPFGATKMLFCHFTRSIASAGSLLILLCLLFDPFIQQVLVFQNQVTFSQSPDATLTKVQGLFSDGAGFEVTQAINAAFWLNDFTIRPSCPSSNCTWSKIQSVALVGECHTDNSWTLGENCTFDFDEKEKESEDATRNCTVTSSDGAAFDTTVRLFWSESCNGIASAPGSICASFYELAVPDYSVVPVPAMYEEGRQCSFLPPNSCPNTTMPFLQYSVLNWTLGGPDWRLALNATRCSLDFYLQENSTSITNGELLTNVIRSEKMVKTYQSQGMIGGQNTTYTCYDSPFEPPQDFSAFAVAIYEATDYSFDRNQTNALPVIYDMTGRNPGFCILTGMDPAYWSWPYTIEPYVSISHNSTGRVTNWAFNSSKVLPQNYTTTGGLDISGVALPVSSPISSISELYYQVFQELGPANVTNNLAHSLTKMLHTSNFNAYQTYVGPPLDRQATTLNGSRAITGQVGTIITLIEVRWFWLVLPLSLSIGGIFFLLYTIYLTKQSRSPIWKSSINALFYHGLDKHPETFSNLDTISNMDRQATGTRVRLLPDENNAKAGGRLVLLTSPERELSSGKSFVD